MPLGSAKKRILLVAGALGLLFAVALLLWPGPDLTIDVMDVGDGDAVLLRTGWTEVLVDAGPDRSVMAGLGESMPLFDRRIEAVILTHPHADHVTGLVHVLRRYRVDRIYYTAPGETPEWQATVAAAEASGVPMELIASGAELRMSQVRLGVIWPPPNFGSAHGDENDYSAVVRVGSPEDKTSDWALLTGDATPAVEAELVGRGLLRPAALLKVAHHGSRFSTTASFLKAVAPSAAVISTGTKFKNHPAWSVLERLRRSGTDVARTDLDGHVRYEFNRTTFSRVPAWRSTWPPIIP
jgi:competence protein ComEC